MLRFYKVDFALAGQGTFHIHSGEKTVTANMGSGQMT
jgi:hypothetical protein